MARHAHIHTHSLTHTSYVFCAFCYKKRLEMIKPYSFCFTVKWTQSVRRREHCNNITSFLLKCKQNDIFYKKNLRGKIQTGNTQMEQGQ